MSDAPDILTKRQFATLLKRHPAFVSRAIADGRLSGAALVGGGRTARICVPVALRQLGRGLDLSQQLAQAHPILPLADGAAEVAGGDDGEAAAREEAAPSAIGQLREEQLGLRNRKAQLEVERAEREAALADGALVVAADVAAELRRQLRPFVLLFDEIPSRLAKALSEKSGLDYAETLITVQQTLRETRAGWQQAAERMGKEAEKIGP